MLRLLRIESIAKSMWMKWVWVLLGASSTREPAKHLWLRQLMNLVAKCVKSSTKGKLVDGENEEANLKNHPTSPRNAVTKQENTTPCPVLWFTWRHVVFWFQISCMRNLMQKRRAFVKCDNTGTTNTLQSCPELLRIHLFSHYLLALVCWHKERKIWQEAKAILENIERHIEPQLP